MDEELDGDAGIPALDLLCFCAQSMSGLQTCDLGGTTCSVKLTELSPHLMGKTPPGRAGSRPPVTSRTSLGVGPQPGGWPAGVAARDSEDRR